MREEEFYLRDLAGVVIERMMVNYMKSI
jgi:hypothetical protein